MALGNRNKNIYIYLKKKKKKPSVGQVTPLGQMEGGQTTPSYHIWPGFPRNFSLYGTARIAP
jgi:hypothetical protein